MIVSVSKESGKQGRPARQDPLDQLIWYIGRAYYTYVGMLEKMFVKYGIDEHLQPGMGHIFFTLYAEDDLTIKEIARRSKLANSTLTGILNRMETKKLIERRRDEVDGRLVRVRLTALGRSIEAPVTNLVLEVIELFENKLGAANVRKAKRLLMEITEAMRDAREE